jgi:predicted PurR-regulated permease PerM
MKQYPFYLKSTVILFGLILFSFAIFCLREVLVPLSFALLLAILLNPVVARLEKWKIPKVWAIAIALLGALILLAILVYFLITQVAGFSDKMAILSKKATELLARMETGINQHFGIAIEKQEQYLDQAKQGMKPVAATILGSVAGSMTLVFLLPVYTFLFLFYKTLLLNFLYEIFAEKNATEIGIILSQTKAAVQSYMRGLVLEGLIVATMNTIALFILGVPYAVLLGLLGALLNVIPFIGGILAVILPLVFATISKDGFSTQLWIIISYLVIQFVDNHFLVPYIVSSKVKINALISIVVVLLGAAAWGISGMFLSIPFVGILKIIFDRIPELRPWGKLLGTEVPTRHKGETWNKIREKLTVKGKPAR